MSSPKTFIEMVPIDKLILDTRLQSRVEINEETVRQYAEAMQSGEEFPPLRAVYADGVHLVVDGWHRMHAAKQAGFLELEAEVSNGTFDDALILAVGANAFHGLPRTNEDKRRALLLLLDDPNHGSSSDRQLAELAKVSQPFVSRIRAAIEEASRPKTVSPVQIETGINPHSDNTPAEPPMSKDEANKKQGWNKKSAQLLDSINRDLQRKNAELEERLARVQPEPADGPVGERLSAALVENERLKAELARAEAGNERLAELYSEANAQVERLQAELRASEAKSLERRDRNLYLIGLLKENGIGYDPVGTAGLSTVREPAPRVQAAARSNECEPNWRGDQARLMGVAKDKPAKGGRQADGDD